MNYHERRQLQVTGLFTNKPLAVRSDRIDPTNKFRRYRDGYDVTSKNYWGVQLLALILNSEASFANWHELAIVSTVGDCQ